MLRILALFAFFLGVSVNAMEVKIHCSVLEGSASCRILNGRASFMSVNGADIEFFEGAGCGEGACDWIGTIHPNYLRDGMNESVFSVMTATTDQSVYAKHRYDFHFAGNRQHQFVSTRMGTEVDRRSTTINLSLQDIDPALYNEYLSFKSDYESVLNGGFNPRKKWDQIQKERQELKKRLDELNQELTRIRNLNFDEIDSATLEKLGIAENQLRVLKARKYELDEFEQQVSGDFQSMQSVVLSRYDAIRARARVYDSELPSLPRVPRRDSVTVSHISEFVEEIRREFKTILIDHVHALNSEDLDLLRRAISDWKRVSGFAAELMDSASALNSTERTVLYEELLAGFKIIYADGVSSDLWSKKNELRPATRKVIDQLSDDGMIEAKALRKNLNFKIIPEQIKGKVFAALDQAEKLSDKISRFDPKSNQQKEAKNIAEAGLRTGLELLSQSIENSSEEAVDRASDSFSIGLMVLDVGLDLVPGVGAVRSAYEIFTGKNLVTGEMLTAVELSMSFVGVFASLTGLNLAKVMWEPSTDLVSKIASKTGFSWFSSRKTLQESLDQVETLLLHYQKNKISITRVAEPDLVNGYLTMKYSRFTKPSFGGSSVIQRQSRWGEELCRLYRKQKDGSDTFALPEGGLFFFRCADIAAKNLKQLIEIGAIPSDFKDFEIPMIGKVLAPANLSVYEGVIREMGGKKGGSIQVFLDITDSKIISQIKASMESIPVPLN